MSPLGGLCLLLSLLGTRAQFRSGSQDFQNAGGNDVRFDPRSAFAGSQSRMGDRWWQDYQFIEKRLEDVDTLLDPQEQSALESTLQHQLHHPQPELLVLNARNNDKTKDEDYEDDIDTSRQTNQIRNGQSVQQQNPRFSSSVRPVQNRNPPQRLDFVTQKAQPAFFPETSLERESVPSSFEFATSRRIPENPQPNQFIVATVPAPTSQRPVSPFLSFSTVPTPSAQQDRRLFSSSTTSRFREVSTFAPDSASRSQNLLSDEFDEIDSIDLEPKALVRDFDNRRFPVNNRQQNAIVQPFFSTTAAPRFFTTARPTVASFRSTFTPAPAIVTSRPPTIQTVRPLQLHIPNGQPPRSFPFFVPSGATPIAWPPQPRPLPRPSPTTAAPVPAHRFSTPRPIQSFGNDVSFQASTRPAFTGIRQPTQFLQVTDSIVHTTEPPRTSSFRPQITSVTARPFVAPSSTLRQAWIQTTQTPAPVVRGRTTQQQREPIRSQGQQQPRGRARFNLSQDGELPFNHQDQTGLSSFSFERQLDNVSPTVSTTTTTRPTPRVFINNNLSIREDTRLRRPEFPARNRPNQVSVVTFKPPLSQHLLQMQHAQANNDGFRPISTPSPDFIRVQTIPPTTPAPIVTPVTGRPVVSSHRPFPLRTQFRPSATSTWRPTATTAASPTTASAFPSKRRKLSRRKQQSLQHSNNELGAAANQDLAVSTPSIPITILDSTTTPSSQPKLRRKFRQRRPQSSTPASLGHNVSQRRSSEDQDTLTAAQSEQKPTQTKLRKVRRRKLRRKDEGNDPKSKTEETTTTTSVAFEQPSATTTVPTTTTTGTTRSVAFHTKRIKAPTVQPTTVTPRTVSPADEQSDDLFDFLGETEGSQEHTYRSTRSPANVEKRTTTSPPATTARNLIFRRKVNNSSRISRTLARSGVLTANLEAVESTQSRKILPLRRQLADESQDGSDGGVWFSGVGFGGGGGAPATSTSQSEKTARVSSKGADSKEDTAAASIRGPSAAAIQQAHESFSSDSDHLWFGFMNHDTAEGSSSKTTTASTRRKIGRNGNRTLSPRTAVAKPTTTSTARSTSTSKPSTNSEMRRSVDSEAEGSEVFTQRADTIQSRSDDQWLSGSSEFVVTEGKIRPQPGRIRLPKPGVRRNDVITLTTELPFRDNITETILFTSDGNSTAKYSDSDITTEHVAEEQTTHIGPPKLDFLPPIITDMPPVVGTEKSSKAQSRIRIVSAGGNFRNRSREFKLNRPQRLRKPLHLFDLTTAAGHVNPETTEHPTTEEQTTEGTTAAISTESQHSKRLFSRVKGKEVRFHPLSNSGKPTTVPTPIIRQSAVTSTSMSFETTVVNDLLTSLEKEKSKSREKPTISPVDLSKATVVRSEATETSVVSNVRQVQLPETGTPTTGKPDHKSASEEHGYFGDDEDIGGAVGPDDSEDGVVHSSAESGGGPQGVVEHRDDVVGGAAGPGHFPASDNLASWDLSASSVNKKSGKDLKGSPSYRHEVFVEPPAEMLNSLKRWGESSKTRFARHFRPSLGDPFYHATEKPRSTPSTFTAGIPKVRIQRHESKVARFHLEPQSSVSTATMPLLSLNLDDDEPEITPTDVPLRVLPIKYFPKRRESKYLSESKGSPIREESSFLPTALPPLMDFLALPNIPIGIGQFFSTLLKPREYNPSENQTLPFDSSEWKQEGIAKINSPSELHGVTSEALPATPNNCTMADHNVCPVNQEYPRDAVEDLLRKHQLKVKQLLAELQLNSEETAKKNDSVTVIPGSGNGELSVCDAVVEDVRPGWARDVISGRWLIIVNAGDVLQNVRIESCLRPHRACLFISPYYKSTCVEHMSERRLLALHPDHPSYGPIVGVFRFPCGCSCKVVGTNTPSAPPL